MRHNDGNWAGYTYEWNAGAHRRDARGRAARPCTVAGQTWEFPSEAQCLQCHSAAAGRTLGLEIGQLNGDFGYPHGPHRQPADHAQRHRHADAGADAAAGRAARDPGSRSAAAPVARAPAPGCTRIARYCHRPGGPTPVEPRPALHHHAARTPRPATSRRRRQPRHRECANHRAGFRGAFGGGGARESHRCRRDAAVVAAHDRYGGCAAADRLGQRAGELQLTRVRAVV